MYTLYIHVYIYVFIHTHTYTFVYIYTYIRIYIYIYCFSRIFGGLATRRSLAMPWWTPVPLRAYTI